MKKISIVLFSVCCFSIIVLNSCGEPDQTPEDYFDNGSFTVKLDAQKAPGHGQYKQALTTSEQVDLKVTVNAPSDLESLQITKTVNLETDESFANSGVKQIDASGKTFTYEFHYDPQIADINQLVGFTFKAITGDQQSTTSDLTVAVNLSPRDNLVTKRWNWKSILHANDEENPNMETIKDCEKDNAYLFNADGTLSLDFGQDTAAGDCALDGLNAYDSWKLTDDEKYFIIKRHGIFSPDKTVIDSFEVKQLSIETLKLQLSIDLSSVGAGSNEIFLYTFKASPRQ